MKVTLRVTQGPHRGREFEFREHDTFIVGRSASAHFRLPIKDKFFSRVHFLIEVNPPRCRLVDMASTNGTHVNGRRVTAIDLHDGDAIQGGTTVLRVAFQDESGRDDVPSPPHDREITPLPMSATVSIPRFRIERELGRGAMGVVYLARRLADDAEVALKTIIPEVSGSPEAVARFLREASVLRQLDHPHVVRFHEVGYAGGRLFFAMEYVSGPDAFELLTRHGGPLPIGRAVDLACQALDALAYAHARGFVHRDLKPHNLLVAASGGRDVVKVADFGLARMYQTSPLSGLTLTGQVAGTSGFMAPEQITSFRESQPAVDQYALGATLYVLLTGKKIYDFRPGFQQQVLMILQEDPVPIRSRRPEIPEDLAEVIHRGLARDPSQRFPDAAAMRDALEPFHRS